LNYVEGVGLQILSKADLEAIHEATLKVLEQVGLKVFGNEALELYSAAGCSVDIEKNLVKIPRSLVEDAIRSSPSGFLMAARDPRYDVFVEGTKVIYTNFGTGTMIEDPESGELRPSTKADLADTARICDAIDEVDIYTIAVTAQDVPEKTRELHEAEAVLNNTVKHFGHDTQDTLSTRRFIEMGAAVAGGMDKLKERPIISLGTCPNSPLELHTNNTEVIIEAARSAIPLDILSMAMAGGTSPVTLAGTLVVTNAEILGGIVLAQLVNKGAPVIYGSSTTMLDLLYTTSPVGAPEHAMIGAAVAQLGHFYEIPTDVGGT
jgi:trimethylamine---corrinoid protein Co-methyltransferase